MISRSVVYHVDTEKEADMSAEALTWLYRQVLNQESNIPCIQICLGTHKEVEIYIHDDLSSVTKVMVPEEVWEFLTEAEAAECNAVSFEL